MFYLDSSMLNHHRSNHQHLEEIQVKIRSDYPYLQPHCDPFCILKRRTFGVCLTFLEPPGNKIARPRTPSTRHGKPGRGDAFSDGVNRRMTGMQQKRGCAARGAVGGVSWNFRGGQAWVWPGFTGKKPLYIISLGSRFVSVEFDQIPQWHKPRNHHVLTKPTKHIHNRYIFILHSTVSISVSIWNHHLGLVREFFKIWKEPNSMLQCVQYNDWIPTGPLAAHWVLWSFPRRPTTINHHVWSILVYELPCFKHGCFII